MIQMLSKIFTLIGIVVSDIYMYLEYYVSAFLLETS